jgi:hypothetical protein
MDKLAEITIGDEVAYRGVFNQKIFGRVVEVDPEHGRLRIAALYDKRLIISVEADRVVERSRVIEGGGTSTKFFE